MNPVLLNTKESQNSEDDISFQVPWLEWVQNLVVVTMLILYALLSLNLVMVSKIMGLLWIFEGMPWSTLVPIMELRLNPHYTINIFSYELK